MLLRGKQLPLFAPEKEEQKLMPIEELLTELMNEVGKQKHNADHSEITRYYAILFTELEKMYAFYLMYLFPQENDMPYSEELE